MKRRKILLLAFLLMLSTAAIMVVRQGYRNALSSPVVRYAEFRLSDFPAGSRPVTIALLSDIHVHGPDMPPARVAAIVNGINALKPDVILIAGDYIGNNWFGADYSVREAIAPLSGLRAKLGVFAVLGNNDHRTGPGAIAAALTNAGVRVLDDDAVQVGPLALGGLDDKADKRRVVFRKDLNKTFVAMRKLPGAKVLLAHRPDVFPLVPPDVTLTLAGHTHCGQIVLPVIGPVFTGSRYGARYICGIRREADRDLLVTGGLGTSHLPLRWSARPDVWLVRIAGTSPSVH